MSYGLIAGSNPTLCKVLAHKAHVLTSPSAGVDAELSAQNPSNSSCARSGFSSRRATQARSAQMAPPDVPLSPTTRCPAGAPSRNIRARTPAVKAVWLPPP